MKKLTPFIVKYKWLVLSTVFFTALKALADLLLPTIMAKIIDVGIANKDIPYISKLGIIMLIIAFFGLLFSVSSKYFAAKISSQVASDLRDKVYKKTINLSFYEVDKIGTSSLITRTTNDIIQIQNAILLALNVGLLAPLVFCATLLISFRENVHLTLVVLVIMLFLSLFIIIVLRFAMPMYSKRQTLVDKLNLIARERLSGIRVIRAFDKTQFEKNKFDAGSQELKKVSTLVNKLLSILQPSVQFAFTLLSIAIIWIGAFKLDSGSLQIGQLMAFLQYASQLMISLMMLIMVFVFIPRAKISLIRVMEVIEIDNEIKDDGILTEVATEGEVRFEDVSFSYVKDFKESDDDILPVINDLNIRLKAGAYHAIVGSTGSGKSTIMKLLERFYEPTSGRILIDDVDIRDYTNKTLKEIISIAPQKTEILTGTVRNNVDINNKLSDDEVIGALKAAGAYDFVSKFDDGIHHALNRGGTNLSGGQKQRISIARAIAKKSAIYIFDDSFSALDSKTEARVKESIFKLLKGKTIIVIAQKIKTIKRADNILVFDNGVLVDNGTHDDLQSRCKIYKEIISSQEGGESYEE